MHEKVSIRSALKSLFLNGKNGDRHKSMLNDPLRKLIPRVALPSIISMLVGAIYSMADTFFVGKLGNSATGAVGIVFPIMNLLQALSFIFAHGASSYVSRLLGMGETERASRTVNTALVLAILTGVLYGTFGLAFLNPILRLFGSTETILPFAADYGIYIYIASPVFAASYVLNNSLRAEGSTMLSLAGMLSGALLNIVLDPICIFLLKMGVGGAGFATMIGQLVGFLVLLSFYLKKTGRLSCLKLSLKLFTPRGGIIRELIRIGFPSFVRMGMGSVGIVLLNAQAAPYGDAAIAAFSIVGRTLFLVGAVFIGYGQGYQPISGYNYGAGRYDRVREAFRFTLITSVALMFICAALFIVFAPNIIGIFRDDTEVISIGAAALRWQSYCLPIMGASLIFSMFFQSTGHAFPAFVSALARQGLFFIPLVLLLPSLFGLFGLIASQPASDVLAFLLILPLAVRAYKGLEKGPKTDGRLLEDIS